MFILLINVMSQFLGFKISEKHLGILVTFCCLFSLFLYITV